MRVATNTPKAPQQPTNEPPLRRSIYWRETQSVAPGAPLRGNLRCDVCIVGGGYTGMWTAYQLKEAEPSLEVAILESDYAGAGASGHNDGFVTPTVGHSLHSLVRILGIDGAKASSVAVGRSIAELRRFCERREIDAELEPQGFYLIATNDHQRRRLESDVSLAQRMGVSSEILERERAREQIDSPVISAALKGPGALVNPHKLARGLACVLRDRGIVLHEGTRALSLQHSATGHIVTTPHGRVSAQQVVLATNAYQHQWEAFRNTVKPVWSYALVTEPLDEDRLRQVHWPGREGFVEARNFIIFARLTANNRLLIGGGPAPYYFGRDMGAQRMRNDAVLEHLQLAQKRFFPAWRRLPASYFYGGCIAITRDLLPHVGGFGNGVYYGYGYCGNGIAMTHTAAKALRDLVLERTTPYSELPFVSRGKARFAKEPIAYIQALAFSRLLAWQDSHPGVISRQLV
jgi:glycine/D-amino acid oxidase-like deaminating enzyme